MPVAGSRNEPLPDMVPQPADAIDIYVDRIAVRKRKGVASTIPVPVIR